jgi:hypothetical protein
MAQTTNYGTTQAAMVEVQMGSSAASWVDVSGFSSDVTPAGGDRAVGEEYTHTGGVITTTGAIGAHDITAKMVYTNPVADPYFKLYHCYLGGSVTNIRWTPSGSAANNIRHATTGGTIVKPPTISSMAASEAKPAMFTFTVHCNTVDILST